MDTRTSTALFRVVLALLALPLCFASAAHAQNVTWTLPASIATCPAGDSVVAGIPSRLRILVRYLDGSGAPKALVPPDSIWVTLETVAGPVSRVYDEHTIPGGFSQVFALDSTNASGYCRIEVPSVVGAGSQYVKLYVSDEVKATTFVTVRSTDANADGETSIHDVANPCDLNYDGKINNKDANLTLAHLYHEHRHALHGQLVRRTNFCETCPRYSPNTIGEGLTSWSPDGSRTAFSYFAADGRCVVHNVATHPAQGDDLIQVSFPPSPLHDYDPSWSPLGTAMCWDRGDNTILRRDMQGANPSGPECIVHSWDDGSPAHRGAIMPAISPDGRWVAFSRRTTPYGPFQLWKVPIGGGDPVQLTFGSLGTDFYPQWSADGVWIVYERADSDDQPRRLQMVPSGPPYGVQPTILYQHPTGLSATNPQFTSDGKYVVAAIGTTYGAPNTHVVDAVLDGHQQAMSNYAEYTADAPYPVLSPRWSPDGTRVSLLARKPGGTNLRGQVWAARRNMNLPPAFSSVDGHSVDDGRPLVELTAIQDEALAFSVLASDPEGDYLTYQAYGLIPGMYFDAPTGQFSWQPGAEHVGQTFHVRFQVNTASGGSDYAVAAIYVVAPLGTPVVQGPFAGASGDSVSQLTYDLTLTPASDRLVLVYVGTGEVDGGFGDEPLSGSPSSVTFNGVPCTLLGQAVNDLADPSYNHYGCYGSLYYLKEADLPGPGTYPVEVSYLLPTDAGSVAAMASFVDQTAPFGTVFTNVAGPPATTISTQVSGCVENGLVVDLVVQDWTSTPAWLPTAPQVQRGHQNYNGIGLTTISISDQPSAPGVTTMSGTASPALGQALAQLTVELKPFLGMGGLVSEAKDVAHAQTSSAASSSALAFALHGVRPNPSRGGGLMVHFTLPSAAPATLELLDITGRLLEQRAVGSLGTGRHAVDLRQGRRLPAGIYLVRLMQGTASRVVRAVVLE